jgi:peptidoglycan biosynthesis protein MviN/MurJ (putative lipid II flippase)
MGWVWLLAYAYALVIALTFQKLILPRMPALHAGQGLLTNDAVYFHQEAVKLAAAVAAQGWGVLHLFQFDAVSGNVKWLAAVYALFGSEPAWFLPITCAFHASSATLLYAIGARLWPGPVGRIGGLVTAVAFTLFPSALQWYGQNHKDAFAIAGTLLIVHAWVGCMGPARPGAAPLLRAALACVAGALLVAAVRSYLVQILAAGLVLGALAWTIVTAARRGRGPDDHASSRWRVWVPILVVGAMAAVLPRHGVLQLVSEAASVPSLHGLPWTWTPTEHVPEAVDDVARRLSTSRAVFVHSAQTAGSLVDGDVLPRDVWQTLALLPRTLQVALFAPFPDMWVDRPTPIRVVGAVETLVWYLFLPGTLLMLLRRPRPAMLALLAFAVAVLLPIAYVQPVVGTIYRMRYGVWMLLLLLGAMGWARIFGTLLRAAERNAARGSDTSSAPGSGAVTGAMTRVAADGSVVLLLWVLTLVGFLMRDLVLVSSNGLGPSLAAFFAASMVPMFLFAVFSAPMADALTGPLVRLGVAEQRRQAQVFLGTSGLLFALLGGALLAWAEPVMGLVLSSAGPNTRREAAGMLRWCTPFLVFSGWTVIGGALLNLRQKSRIVAVGQLAAAVSTVVVLLLLEQRLGIHAAIAGMLVGMAANTAIVAWAAAREGIALVPALPRWDAAMRRTAQNYLSLVLAALFSAAVVPLNYGFAGSLGGDAAPSWAFASKLVQVLTTTAGFAIGAVVLPHLASLVAQRQSARLRSDAFFLLALGSWLAVVCALMVDVLAEPVALAVISGRTVSADQVRQLAGLLRLGALQLPFVVCTAIVLKVAAVSGAAWRVTLAAGVGFVVNFGAGLLLPQALGVDGIGVAAVAGAATACTVLLLLARGAIGLSRDALGLLVGAWLALALLFLAQAYADVVAVLGSIALLVVIAGLQWRRITRQAAAGAA